MKQVIEAKRLNLGVMASGRGSNFDAIYAAIERKDLNADIKVLISDKKEALVLRKAEEKDIPAIHINPKDYASLQEYEAEVARKLKEFDVDIVVLAGYMRLVGPTLLNTYPNRIVNIHPSLLPAFKGLNAQKQALDYGVRFTGCTVHLVDEGMDTGPIIMQAVVPVYIDDTEEVLANRILQEEHQIYWRSLQLLAEGRVYVSGRKTIIKEKWEER